MQKFIFKRARFSGVKSFWLLREKISGFNDNHF